MLTELDREFVDVATSLPIADPFGDWIAAVLLGRLLERNRVANIDAIVSAAEALARTEWEAEHEDGLNHLHGPDAFCDGLRQSASRGPQPFDRPAFFRAVVTEYLGGAKVRDVFGEIKLKSHGPCCRFPIGNHCDQWDELPHVGRASCGLMHDHRYDPTVVRHRLFSVPAVERSAE